MIEWVDIHGYEGLYILSEYGEVKSLDRTVCWKPRQNSGSAFKSGKIIVPKLNEKGYLRVCLCKNNKPKNFRVSRLVAIHFIPNPLNLPEVNHDDGNKLNNHKSNLFWDTRKGNMRHAVDSGLCKNTARFGEKNNKSKAVLNTQYGIFYDSITEAANSFGVKTPTLQAQLNGINPLKFPLSLLNEKK